MWGRPPSAVRRAQLDFSRSTSIRSRLLHHRPNLPPRHPRRNLIPCLHQPSILHQLPRPIKHQSIPPLQNRQRRKRLQRPPHAFNADFILQQLIPHRRRQSRSPRRKLPANPRQHSPQIVMPHCRRQRFPTTPHQLQRRPLPALHAKSQIIHLLLPLPDQVHHPHKRPMLRPLHQRMPRLQQLPLHRPHQPLPRRLRLRFHFHPRPDHQLRRRRRRCCPQVRHKIHNREIRFVPHRRNHRNPRRRHRPRQSFIIESRQIFRRPTTASHNNHFHRAALIAPHLIEMPHTSRDL